MINLLPPEQKRQIRAGQSNLLLLRYCVISILLAILLFAVIAGVYFIMIHSKQSAETTIQESTAKSSKYQKVQQDVTTFNNNLTTAKTILDKQVNYSKVALKIAQTLPSGIVLDSLQLNAQTFGQPMTLNAKGKNYGDALRLKEAFEKSPVFDNVFLQTVTMGDDGASIVINVTIKPEVAKS